MINEKKVYYLIGKTNLVINSVTYPDLGYLALVNCRNMSVHHLEFKGNGQGMLLAYTTGSIITKNQITDNYAGILLFDSSSNHITTNDITDNYRGIQFSSASKTNGISNNTITDNTYGIALFNSFQNTITLNNIANNKFGISFKDSSSNIIRGNYFVDNEKQVYDVIMEDPSVTSSINTWDGGYQAGGNYWSDYTGVDVKSGKDQNQTGSDGFGDTPYIIYKNNQDNYPLMPYGSPPAISIISPENKTYTVNSVALSFTLSKPTSWIKYSLDGQANVTITGDTTLSDLPEGVHSITVYAEDMDGKVGMSETVYFTIAERAEPLQPGFSIITLIAAIIAVTVVIGVLLFFFMRAGKK